MATAADLEAAIAALPAKKQRLRETFDRLVACSPVPISLRWEDLDAHLSSLLPSIAVGFRQHGSLPLEAFVSAGGPAIVANQLARHPVEHLEREDPESRVGRAVRMEDQESNGGEREEAKHVGEAFSASTVQDEAGNGRADEEEAIEASLEQEDDEEEYENANGSMEASPRKGDEEIMVMKKHESVNACTDQEGDEDEVEEAKRPQPDATAVGGGESALVQAIMASCANMDASTLVDMLLCLNRRSCLRARRAFLPALLGAADPHALVIAAVRGFLAGAEPKTDRGWANCVALLDCVPRLATGIAALPVSTLEQAERLAREWKEMVGKPGICRDMGRLAGWGLFTFLVSYNIVLEFDADEIIGLFGNLPRHKTNKCFELCKRLGLIEKMDDSIIRLIEDGRPIDAIRLAHALNLTQKYPPVSIMYDFVEKAKRTAEEILSKESDSLESLNQVMAKKVNALILSWTAVDECYIDSDNRDNIKAEITQLLHIYANKQQSLSGVSASGSASHQLHNLEEQSQQQRKPHEPQRKPQEKHQHQQHKTQEVHQQKLQNQQGLQEQGWGWQNSMARKRNKNHKRNLRRKRQQNPQEQQRRQQYNKRSRFSSYSYSGIRGVPFADRTRTRRDFGLCSD
ncbi:hypothetical protein ACP70R_024960 [Stipagrostis hirtigluma subsp. patula]